MQKHAATRLHYDFRLELDGVLKSWAVTRGPSDNPRDKRLAVQVEDHPLKYGSFEGTIPQGAYGGGTVMLWDVGHWEPVGDPREALAKGSLRMRLEGSRMHGEWSLVRMKKDGRGSRENWLLIKHRDAFSKAAESLVPTFTTSVKTGRSLDEIATKTRPKSRGAGPAAKVSRTPAVAPAPASRAAISAAAGIDAAARRKIRLTSPDRAVYPEQGVTKAMLVAYYDAIAERMLPYVADRPLALLRCPQGPAKHCFFQKHDTGGFPPAMKTLEIADNQRKVDEYFYVTSVDGLIAGTQMNVLEWHLWGARRDKVERPERLIFDLDPADGISFADVRSAAHDIGRALEALGLVSFPLVSGGKGIHVIAPITRRSTWDSARAFSRAFAQRVSALQPDRFMDTASKARREGRIYIDYRRNERGASAIAPWSCRSRAGAPVAVPVRWDELPRIDRAGQFSLEKAVARASEGDPWSGYSTLRQPLPRLAE